MTFQYFYFVICKQGKEDLEKKLLLQHYMDRKKQSLEVFYKKSYSFAILTGKDLSWSLSLIQFQAFISTTVLQSESNTCVFM